MTDILLADLIREKLKPLDELDKKFYNKKGMYDIWQIIRNTTLAFEKIADELEKEEDEKDN